MKSYKELVVWQKAIKLVTDIYQVTRAFPQEERYALTSQTQRAATSIPANIAEGWGRGSTREYLQFLRVARGSLIELETHLIVANNLNYLPEPTLAKLQGEVASIGMMLNRLMQSLNKR